MWYRPQRRSVAINLFKWKTGTNIAKMFPVEIQFSVGFRALRMEERFDDENVLVAVFVSNPVQQRRLLAIHKEDVLVVEAVTQWTQHEMEVDAFWQRFHILADFSAFEASFCCPPSIEQLAFLSAVRAIAFAKRHRLTAHLAVPAIFKTVGRRQILKDLIGIDTSNTSLPRPRFRLPFLPSCRTVGQFFVASV